jgi:hypothetical protein
MLHVSMPARVTCLEQVQGPVDRGTAGTVLPRALGLILVVEEDSEFNVDCVPHRSVI